MSLSDIETLISYVFFRSWIINEFLKWCERYDRKDCLQTRPLCSPIELPQRWPVTCDRQKKKPADNQRVFRVFLRLKWIEHDSFVISLPCFPLFTSSFWLLEFRQLELFSTSLQGSSYRESTVLDCTQSLTWLKYVQCWEVGCVRLHVA